MCMLGRDQWQAIYANEIGNVSASLFQLTLRVITEFRYHADISPPSAPFFP